MSQHVDQRVRSLMGRTLIDAAGQRIGRVEDIYTDDVGGQPAWIAVATGRFGLNVIFLPFAGAIPAGGDELRVRFPRDLVKQAPTAGTGGRLTQEEVVRLYDHYGFDLEAEEVRERAMNGRPRRAPGGWKPASRSEPASTRAPAPSPTPAAAAERPVLALGPAAAVEHPAAPAEEGAAPPKPPAAPARRPTTSLFGNLVEPTTVAERPAARPDSPLFWNHDDRIDSIRPPREPAPPGRR